MCKRVLVTGCRLSSPQILWCEGGVAYGKKDCSICNLRDNRAFADDNFIAKRNVAAPILTR
jgi:hypothetical protein